MANRSTIVLDGIDVTTKGVTVLDYSGLSFAGYKDSGFKNPEGIDGVLNSSSTAISGLTGSITILIKGTSEAEVNNSFRTFKLWLRSKSFWKISTKEDPTFYRLGKFLGESEPGVLTEVPMFGEAHYVTKINIQFKDGYEYSTSTIEKNYTYQPAKSGDTLSNPGRPTRQVRFEIRATSTLTGYFRITNSEDDLFVEFGTNGPIIENGSTIILNLGTFELVKVAANKQVTNLFRYIKRGEFFKVPSGNPVIQIHYRPNDSGSWTTNLPVQVKMTLSPSYY